MRLALAASMVAAALPAAGRGVQPPAPAAAPLVAYAMEFDLAGNDPRLTVHLSASGLDPSRRGVVVHLPDHGEWTEVDSLYLRALRGVPGIRPRPDEPSRWDLEAPSDWDGSIELSFTVPLTRFGSRLHERHGLLPWYVADADGGVCYAAALSENTLPRLLVDGEPADAPVEIVLRAPEGMSVATGWGGVDPREQLVMLENGLEDAPIFVGAPRVARAPAGDAAVEVIQFAGAEDVTGPVLDAACRLAGAYAASTGRGLGRPIRVFINDKGGGQMTPWGLLVQRATAEEAASPEYRHLLAHELFHHWLGGHARAADGSLAWFQEGFTDYLSLLHLAASGLVDRRWFIERMLSIDESARASTAHGAVAFGGPGVAWRDGNGPNETLAYRGGAALALCIDAELFRRGGPRLASMIGDLAAQGDGTYTLGSIRAWLDRHGLTGVAAAHIDRPGLPELDPALLAIGLERVPADLGYTGVRTSAGTMPGTVTAIDPDGPAAACGLRVGDVITGCWRCRPSPPALGPDVATEFRFGLDLFDPAAGEVNLGVRRGEEALTLKLLPRAMPGGCFWRPSTKSPATLDSFLDLPERKAPEPAPPPGR